MSFEIARSGINAVSGSLETISQNIANAGTMGFKSSRANFSAMYAGTRANGAELSSVSQSIGRSGGLFNTGRGMDAMIQGRGFFAVRDGKGEEVYTRVGIFEVDKDGYVVDALGRRAQGYAAVLDAAGKPVAGGGVGALGDLKLRTGQIGAQASDKLTYNGNLSADWQAKVLASFDKNDPSTYNASMTSVIHDSLGSKHSVDQYFVKTGANTVEVAYSMDGTLLPSGSVTVDNAAWAVVSTDDGTGAPAGVTVTPNPPVVGQPQTYTWTYAGGAPATADTVTLGFGSKGQLQTVNGVPVQPRPYPTPADWTVKPPAIDVALGTPPSADPITLDVDYAGLTQFAGDSITLANSANGYGAGILTGTMIAEDGSVMATYSNGLSYAVGTLALVTFANEDALVAVSDTSWTASGGSGTPLYQRPGTGMAGTLAAGSLEQSNVDMTSELVNLMSAQRNYQANSKVLSAQNEMMQTLMQAI